MFNIQHIILHVISPITLPECSRKLLLRNSLFRNATLAASSFKKKCGNKYDVVNETILTSSYCYIFNDTSNTAQHMPGIAYHRETRREFGGTDGDLILETHLRVRPMCRWTKPWRDA